jgi:hypothetical protein
MKAKELHGPQGGPAVSQRPRKSRRRLRRTPCQERWKVSTTGYVVTYVQTSKEEGTQKGSWKELCANNHPGKGDRWARNRRLLNGSPWRDSQRNGKEKGAILEEKQELNSRSASLFTTPETVGASLDKLGRFAFGPRVVGDAQVDAVGDSGMIEKEEDVYGIRVGID